MSYETARALRTALEERLRRRATTGELVDAAVLGRLRKRVTFERFLARLTATVPAGWVLKGGFALEIRLGDLARATKDIDIDWTMSEREVFDLLRRAAEHDLGDFFAFRIELAESPPDPEGAGQRWRLIAELDAREFETVLVDVGVDAGLLLGASELRLPTALDFAGEEPIAVPVLGLEQHVAEKELDAGQLNAALTGIFEQRGTHDVPSALPAPPVDWQLAWRRFADELPIPADLHAGHDQAAALIDPVVADRASGRWSPEALAWRNG